jgi:hypothetical protein
LRMGAPKEPGRMLHLIGYCPEGLGAARASVSIDGMALQPVEVRPGKFDLAFRLPDAVTNQREMHVSLDLDKAFRPPGETRDLGLSFGVFEIR